MDCAGSLHRINRVSQRPAHRDAGLAVGGCRAGA